MFSFTTKQKEIRLGRPQVQEHGQQVPFCGTVAVRSGWTPVKHKNIVSLIKKNLQNYTSVILRRSRLFIFHFQLKNIRIGLICVKNIESVYFEFLFSLNQLFACNSSVYVQREVKRKQQWSYTSWRIFKGITSEECFILYYGTIRVLLLFENTVKLNYCHPFL